MSKPTNKPGWNPTNLSEPSSTKKSQGWAADEKPSAAQINWLLKTISQWIDHVDLDRVKGETGDAGPVGSKGLTGDAGSDGLKGETGDTGPQGSAGSASLSAADEARLANLENIANVSSPATVNAGIPYSGQALNETLSASTTIDWSVSLSQRIVLSGNSTLSFANGVSGKVYFLSVQQPSGGSATVTWPGNVSWDSGSAPVLSTNDNRKDIFGFYFNGSNYIGYAVSGFQNLPVLQSGSETKNGYIAGGGTGGSNGGSYLSTVEKINLNSDTNVFTTQVLFGIEKNETGSKLNERVDSFVFCGQGTQSSTHGYRIYQIYGSSSRIAHKLMFANDTGAITNVKFSGSGSLGGTNSHRQGIVQSTTKAYIRLITTLGQLATLLFSTDTDSASAIWQIPSGTNATIGISTADNGSIWGLDGTARNRGISIQFSNESVSNHTSFLPSPNFLGGVGEAVDGPLDGYYQKTSTTTGPGSSVIFNVNKTTNVWSSFVTTLAGGGTGAAATQGQTAGYFCGGNNSFTNGTDVHTFAGLNQIKKITYSSQLYSTHSATLSSARHFSAGFEG